MLSQSDGSRELQEPVRGLRAGHSAPYLTTEQS